MGETSIQWCDFTFNPWWGCQRVSPGCEHCYAETLDRRVGGGVDPVDGVKKLRWGPSAPRIRTSASNWKQPLRWNRDAEKAGVRKRVFCASMADVFEDRDEVVPWRVDLFKLIEATPALDWLLLTKRPENIQWLMPARGWKDGDVAPWPNVWLGTTVEDQQRANERIPKLLDVPAVVRFLSCEPLLQAVDLRRFLRRERFGDGRGMGGGLATGPAINWVIIGGESGGNARPFDVAWARSLVRQVVAHGAKPFVKQLGAHVVDRNDAGFEAEHDVTDDGFPTEPGAWPTPKHIEESDTGYQGAPVRVHLADRAGGEPSEWPIDLRVREFPEVRR